MHIPCQLRLISNGSVRWVIYPALLLALWFYFSPRLHAGPYNGFDLSHSLVPVTQIDNGGPARDGIPAIDRPRFVTASQAGFMRGDDRILGINLNGRQKAYPLRILNYHEIVNDRFDDIAVVVSYCPLCGTGMAFLAGSKGIDLDFGVSGLLYNSDVLLYDRQTESLWSQIRKQAIAGPLSGQTLQQIPMEHTSWSDWQTRYPQTRVLSLNTGYRRDYSRSPYAGYASSEELMFDVIATDPRFHTKEQVIGMEINGIYKAYPFLELSRNHGELVDEVGGQTIRLVFDSTNRSGRVYAGEKLIPSTTSFWFAWYAFHPETLVYQTPE
ncbi:hypothetical protein MNBD_GAMMA15-1916 [hydrothermal vent metagenome]|uniref:DUF3179 domain-containing protein n=1 Tax=hydrothermal vent metagenome TaxID=652676 RepID=A0A3B0YHE0_9ZZZZ